MPAVPAINTGKTMSQEAAETPQSYSSVFNSSVPQRPAFKPPSYGGRPLGPHTYDPAPPGWPMPYWLKEIDRQEVVHCFKMAEKRLTNLFELVDNRTDDGAGSSTDPL